MRNKVNIATNRIKIKTLQISDITQAYIVGLNDPEVNKFLVNVRLIRQNRKTLAAFIRKNLNDKNTLLLGLFKKTSRLFIGTIRITEISYFHRCCAIGICIFDKNYWDKGYATESLRKVCEFIFRKLKLHYIEAGVYEANRSSMNLFRKAGFKIQARYENKYRYQNDFRSVVIWSKINPAFNTRNL